MAEEKEKKERINIFLSKDDIEFLQEYADFEGSNVSMVIRRLVKKFISQKREALRAGTLE